MSRDRPGRAGSSLDRAWSVLGLAAGASADEVIAARRRLARRAHPDTGGSVERMQELNEAADRALAAIEHGTDPSPSARRAKPPQQPRPRPATGGVRRDHPSFTIEALPVEAFEGLLLAGAELGEIADDEPPYRLDVVLGEPLPAWCRLELVPDAGASTVSLTTARVPGQPTPDIDEVRDRWVEALNRLDWSDLGGLPPS